MTQIYSNTKNNKGTHLNYEERIQIQTLKKLGYSNRAIARELGRAPQTIHNEIKRGSVRQLRRQRSHNKIYEYEDFSYVPSLAQQRYQENRQRSGAKPLWCKIHKFIEWADNKMKACKWSPQAVIGYARHHEVFSEYKIPSVTTLYSWIDKGIMRTKNIDLLEKTSRRDPLKTSYRHPHRRVLGPSIEKRPKEVNHRQSFGHWEIDTVIGTKDKTKPVILTLVERQTRFEILRLIECKTAGAVSKSLSEIFNLLGNKASNIFKSITSDNGSEFASLYEDFNHQTDIYFTHPFSSFERGTSENQHKMIRRFIPKGYDFSNISSAYVQKIQQYMNDYSRRILGYDTAHHRMARALKQLNIF